jgi:hypothetical protein
LRNGQAELEKGKVSSFKQKKRKIESVRIKENRSDGKRF